MKQNLLFNQASALGKRLAMVLTMLLTIGIGTMWGESIEINTSNSGVDGSYRNYEFDVSSITFGCNQWMKNNNIQAKKSTTNSLYNVDAIPGIITSIVVKQTGTARAIKIYGGTSTQPTTQITSPTTAAEMTFDFIGQDYTYFSLTTPGNACYFDKITINYTPSGGGGDNGECTWELVTDVSTLKDGDKVVIAAKDYNYAISTTQNGNNRGQASVTKNTSNNTITFGDDVQILTLEEGNTSGTLAFYTGNGYLYAASSGSNYMRTETTLSDNSSWEITIADDGTATVVAQGTNTRNTMQYNQSSSIFSCYSSASQKAIVIYKEVCTGGSTETLVTLHPNGGDGEETTATIEGTTYTVTDCSFTRDGYTFSHWDTQADDSGVDYDPDDIINLNGTPITLYAQWECTMASISISGAYALTQGQEFLLTAIAKDSEGNEIECPDDAIYTWQYWDGSNWQDVNDNESSDKTKLQYASCNVVDHCGKFRCIISYGDCIAYSNTNTQDDGYKVHVYHIKGFGEWSTPYPFIYDANTGEAVLTMELEAYTTYVFSIFGSSTQFFNGGTITANATDWVYGLTNYGNTKITTTIAGVYIFTLDYSGGESNNLKLDVTYPSKRIIYLEPNIWGTDPKFAVHAWGGNSTEDILMTKIDDCASRNIYYAEIDASQTNVIFIRGNTDTYDISNPWDNVWNQTVDLTLGNDNLFYVDNWHDANDYNKSNGYWTTFTPNYLITFDVQGHGTAPEDQCIAENGTATTPTAPTATGYTFGGWYKEAGCTNAYDFSTAVTSSITLYAKWTINTHTVTWKPAGGNWSGDTNDIVQTYEYDELIEAPEKPVRTGYEFVEWKPTYTADMTMPDKDLEFTAQWQINQYTVTLHPNYPDGKTGTFKDKDGNTISGDLVLTYDYGTASQTLTDLYQSIKLDGYRFDGWYNAKGTTDGTISGSKWSVTGNITSDLNFYAKWTEVDCRWIETDIANILPEDEVLITMKRADDGDTYTLDHSKGTSELPPAPTITIHGNEAIFTTFYHSNSIWNISGNATDGYILYPNGSKTTWLYCTKSNYNVKVGTTTSNVFTIENGYLKHTNTDWVAYLGVYIDEGNPIWRHHNSPNAPSIAGQTLKFYKRVCVDASIPWYTVTFNAGSGSCNTESLTGTEDEGITLPTATLSDACDTDGWTFAGWATTSVDTETETEPTLIAAGAYSPTSDITLYAVYQRTETIQGGGSGNYELVTSAPSDWSGTYLIVDGASENCFNGSLTALDAGGNYTSVTISDNTITSNTTTDSYSVAISKSTTDGKYYIKTASGYYIGSTASTSSDGNDLKSSTSTKYDNSISISSNNVTIKGPDHILKFSYQSGQSWRFRFYKSTTTQNVRLPQLYKKSAGGGSTTYYHSTPDCGPSCEKLGAATGLTVETDFVHTDGQTYVKFSWTPADNTKNYATNQKICFGKVGEAGTCVDDLANNITWTGDLKSKLEPGEYWWSIQALGDGVNYCDGDVVNGTNFTIEAPTYTVTFNAGSGTCDDESLTETSGGAGVTLPTANPPATCATDGWKFAGWWTESLAETTTSPGELLTDGSNYKPTSDCTLYAVYSYTEAGGSGSTDYVLTNIGDIADDDIVIITMTYTDGTVYALSSSNESSDAPPAPTVTVSDNKLSAEPADALKWNISNSSGTLTIYPNGTTEKWLYCTDSNNGVRIGTNANKAFTIDASSGYLKNTPTNRYVGVYRTNPDWRCYDNTTENTANQTLGFYVKSSGGSTTIYNSNPVCVASWSITYDFAGGTGSHCSNTSVPQGDTYTICEEEPTKEGHTFQGWSDGTTTYGAGATITPTGNVILTAQWQINTYTVIWSNNGATTEESYEHGQTLNVPAPEDIPSCDGVKEFVGWTEDNTFTYHATTPPSDLFTEKTATVTANATYYAVFATPPGTGGGGGGSETTTTLDFTAQGYADATAISNLTVDGVTATFAKGSNGSNAPKYYTNGTAIRAYGGNTITLSATQITAATFTFGSSDGSNAITADCGSWDSPTWTGDATDEVVFTISGSSGNRRIQSIAVTCTSGGGSGSYSDYTTICQQIESIEVQNPQTEFYLTNNFTIGEGKVIATLSGGGTADVTALATFSGYDMEKVGTYTVTVTYMGATATYNINVKPLDNAWVLTWNVSGKTNTGLGPRTVTKGSAIGTLPVPEVPAACEGKTFMGWTESNIVPSDGKGIVYITEETKPTDNTTYYAVFATVNNFCTQKPIDQIASGSKVVIVAVASLTADGGSGKAISSRATDDTYNLQGDDVAIYDQTINTPHSTCIWTITKSGEKYIFIQDGKYLNGVLDGMYSNLKYLNTEDSWTLHPAQSGMTMTYNMESTNASGEYIEWYRGKFAIHNEVNKNGDFDMQFYVTLGDGEDITDYTTGCEEYTITYYGFRGGYSTSTSSDGIIILPVNSLHTVPDCGDVVKDHTDLGREFLNLWMTQPHGGQTFKPGDTFILTQDTTLYAQWKLNTTTDVTLPTGVEDLAGTDVYVYGGNTLTMVPDIVTINSLTLKGGLQPDGSYQMPNVWIPDGATLVRNTNKIYLDLAINAKNWYPFAVPFATKNDQYLDYLDPVLRGASTYGKHFAIKTYDGARRAEFGEDKANNWTQLKRHTGGTTSYLEPGVGYIISAMTKSDKDTATIRIPMTVPNTWFENGEQTVVGSTSRNTIAVTAHTGAAATEHRRHAGWNFIASPYLSEFAGNKVDNDGKYINGWINIANQYNYEDTEIPYVTIPVYNFAYYEQKKVSEATLSPEWSFFVQIAVDGTINFVEEGRQTVPAGIAARTQEERSVKMDIDINLTDGRNTDQMGIIVCEKYSDAYEIGRDLEKMFGSAYNLVVYSLMNDNTPLAYQAVPLLNETHAIPIGYRAPEQGEYTFSLKQNTSSIDLLNEQYEQLVLVDYEKGALTNLLNSDYTFSSERTQSNSRFALYAVPRQDSSTELPNISDEEDAIRKIFYNGHLFIIRNGNVYNGNGQIVK